MAWADVEDIDSTGVATAEVGDSVVFTFETFGASVRESVRTPMRPLRRHTDGRLCVMWLIVRDSHVPYKVELATDDVMVEVAEAPATVDSVEKSARLSKATLANSEGLVSNISL